MAAAVTPPRWSKATTNWKLGGSWPSPHLLILLASTGGLSLGFLLSLAELPQLGNVVWGIAAAPSLVYLGIAIVTELRRGNAGLDIVAAMSMTGAVAICVGIG